jgi:hypothetical protein
MAVSLMEIVGRGPFGKKNMFHLFLIILYGMGLFKQVR